jgi:DNA (cytosine-5)-methyltransferase 1
MKNAAEFFAGIGLVRMALEAEDWRVLFANDIEPRKKQMYEHHFGSNGEFQCSDIRKIKGAHLPNFQLATASFPCIDLSLAGNRAGLKGKHSSLFWEFARVLKEMRFRKPEWILLENVAGLLTSHAGQDLAEIIAALNQLGYACDLALVETWPWSMQSISFHRAGRVCSLQAS